MKSSACLEVGESSSGEAAGRLAVAPWSIYRDSVSLYLLKHRPGGIIFPISAANRLIVEIVQSRRRPQLGPFPG